MGGKKVTELTQWREVAREELESLQQQIGQLQQTYEETRERLTLLDRLLMLEGGSAAELRVAMDGGDDLFAACETILRDNGGPMHIRGLYEALLARHVPIPGKGIEANLIARLQRSEGRFVRTGRGMYGLPEFGVPESKPSKQRRRAKKG